MATTREIKNRITSIKNTQKITKAMEMVASVKLRKARDAIISARPYAVKLTEVAGHLRSSIYSSLSPMLIPREVKKISLVIVSSDKGLCGGFNANIMKKARQFIKDHSGQAVELTIIGKKAADYFKADRFTVRDKYTDIFFKPGYADASRIGEKLLNDFLSGAVDEVCVVYNEFKNAVVQKTMCDTLLPVPEVPGMKSAQTDYLLEPEGSQSLDFILSKYFVFQIWRVILDSYASEQGARMSAMSGASKNAGEIIDRLVLYYNKARQAAITKELLEVVAGAESLR